MKIKFLLPLLALVFCLLAFSSSYKTQRVLVFSLTKGFRHGSIHYGKLALLKMAREQGFVVDTSENANVFTTENLKKYKAIVLLSPTGTNVFSAEQKNAFVQFVQNGGGVVGVHAATDFCYEWEWYGKMIGAYFQGHPAVQQAKIVTSNPSSKLLKGLVFPWLHRDEWYNYKNVNPGITVLLKLDETSYKGGNMKNDHPMTWYHEFDGGKVFYTGMGHTDESFEDPAFLKLLSNGLNWAMK